MGKLLECQKALLLNRWYDVKTDSLMYECRNGDGKRKIIALDCDDLTVDEIKHNPDWITLKSFTVQCCKNCKEVTR